jgi:hypothetical protein
MGRLLATHTAVALTARLAKDRAEHAEQAPAHPPRPCYRDRGAHRPPRPVPPASTRPAPDKGYREFWTGIRRQSLFPTGQ